VLRLFLYDKGYDKMLKIISKPYKKQVGNSGKYKFVKAQCECGNIKEYRLSDIKNNHTKSCGCLMAKLVSESKKTHGMSNTRMYNIWKDMKRRCKNKNRNNYKHYGGKGISVCKEWDDNFINFYNWSINNGYKENLSIDRIDSDKNYTPENCQWITMSKNIAKSNKNRNPKFIYYIKSPKNKEYIRYNRTKIRNEFKINDKTIAKLLKKQIKDYNGWELKREKYKEQ